jgi:hypothetical protein
MDSWVCCDLIDVTANFFLSSLTSLIDWIAILIVFVTAIAIYYDVKAMKCGGRL